MKGKEEGEWVRERESRLSRRSNRAMEFYPSNTFFFPIILSKSHPIPHTIGDSLCHERSYISVSELY